jgi:hypothetical protein
MKTIATASLLSLLSLLACGGGNKPAEDPSGEVGATAPSSSPTESTNLLENRASAAPPADSASIADDAPKKSMDCSGANIADLVAVVSQVSCEVQGGGATKSRDVKDVLEITAATDAPKIAPGAKTAVTVTFKNKGKAALPLDFTVDPEPRFEFQLYTPKGKRIDVPTDKQPPLPESVANATTPPSKTARVTLAPNGTAKVNLTWDAVKYKWASAERAKGALPGRGYPREPAGPLANGKYVLRVIMPLTGVAEGMDHEVSQPKIPIEIGSP